jgi:1-phosphatidylinositol-4-phosphate 5-kinase
MKDLNWEKRAQKLQLGPTKRKIFITQLLRDVKLLVRMNIMDYSLMIGVHDIVRGNKENVRNSTLQTFQVKEKTTPLKTCNSLNIYSLIQNLLNVVRL